jgi:formamidopyrimidine-DNA glycosylase
VPELPEVEALAEFLRERAAGRTVLRADVAAFSAVKTFDPPITTVAGDVVAGASRFGKFLSLDLATPDGEPLHLVMHLARGGWLQWRDALPPAPPRPGKSPLAFRLHLEPELPGAAASGFDLTEMGTQKRLAVYFVRDVRDVPGVARLGPDALSLTRDQLAGVLSAHRGQLKRALTDQELIAGIGNAYSDEILHVARLSPFKNTANVSDDEIDRLFSAIHTVLTDAVQRSVGQRAATLKAEKRTGLRVHARAGLPCPVCGDTVRSVNFADRHFEYCPTCQTEGRPLADRRMSKLLK